VISDVIFRIQRHPRANMMIVVYLDRRDEQNSLEERAVWHERSATL
jgi:hypothetical protein